ncbi:hypothetical protein D9757_009583 [Collybiopsis confluens]|uniref:Gfo/Idh/MocA-like oxidoreductase N-terminal domain-containing protein n=1 Tax=Collybiopsis confluens TaxID=2823264 RepID=A0A8H5G7S2_9AGAR|nr:hypothetical protein D9757_012337 [Collybiopsis confluens]KAF5359952.1 hypothetical protein D9757_012241 [Collybiopsis confluens]KAF5376586.1 hypothetical protein D9757_009583 [Collybiopsis confluens]
MSPIRVGFVGLSKNGWATTILAPTLVKNDKYRLIAVSTTSKDSAEASAAQQKQNTGHEIAPYFGSTSQIANDPNVDFVAVAVKSPSHRDALIPVIEAGKNFFIEWPAGKNLKETREFAAAAHAKGLKTIVGLQGRHTVVIKKVKELIDSGAIGKVLSTSIIALSPRELRYWGPEVAEKNLFTALADQGSSMIEVAIGHHLDTFTHVLGDFASVSATTAVLYPTANVINADGTTVKTIDNVDSDHIAFTGLLKSGAIASVTWRSGYASKGRQQLVWEIDGEKGAIRLTDDQIPSAYVHIRDPKLYLNGELVEVHGGGLATNIAAGWEEFTKGNEGKHATIDDAVRIRGLIEAIGLSGQEGRRVNL